MNGFSYLNYRWSDGGGDGGSSGGLRGLDFFLNIIYLKYFGFVLGEKYKIYGIDDIV